MASDERQQRIDDLFDKASSLSPKEQGAYLDDECRDDPFEVRHEVEKLLRAHAHTPLVRPQPLPGFEKLSRVAPKDPMIDRQVGAYLIRRRLGQGGFGAVYLAERVGGDYEQKVAIKLIRPDRMAEERILQRFELERQALADLRHDNIARLLDGGSTEEGWPFFVMEYVEGLPLTEYCDKEQKSVRDRLLLFKRICAAVKHAHDYGYIHRDIKPSNLLVTKDGEAKLLDFGIAKLVDPRSRSRLISLTEDGVPGTPEYASPEQVRGDRQSISTATDVYSLGVLLYQLITGHHPFNFRRLLVSEIQRVIFEEEPRHPSAVVMKPLTHQTAEGLTSSVTPQQLCERRQTTPLRLRRMVRGDLETVILKAINKEPSRRYNSPAALAEDIDNYLNGLPITARAVGRIERCWRWGRRHPAQTTGLAASIVAIIALATLTVGYSYQMELEATNAQLRTANGELDQSKKQLETSLDGEKALTVQLREARQNLDRILYFRRVSLALSHFKDAELFQAKHLLEQCPDALRNWEWFYVFALSHSELLSFEEHEDSIKSIAFSNDGTQIVSLDKQKIRLWNTSTEETSLTLETDNRQSVAFNPVGNMFATGGQSVDLWDATTGRLVRSFGERDASLFIDVRFSSTGDRISAKGIRSTLSNGKLMFQGEATVWNAKNGSLVLTVNGEEDNMGAMRMAVAISPDGSRLATSEDKVVRVWNTSTGDETVIFDRHESPIVTLAFSPDGEIIASADEVAVRFWETTTGREKVFVSSRLNRCLVFTPDGTRLVTANRKDLNVWDTARGTLVSTLRGHELGINTVTCAPDGTRLASGSTDGTVKLWRLKEPPQIEVSRGDLRPLGLAFSPNGRRLATGGRTLKIWDVASRQELISAQGHLLQSYSKVAFSTDGRHVLGLSLRHGLEVFDADNGSKVLTLGDNAYLQDFAIAPDNKYIFGASLKNGTVFEWNRETGEEREIWRTNESLSSTTPPSPIIAVSPDGSSLVISYKNRVHAGAQIRVLDIKTGREVWRTSEHQDLVSDVTYSPNGNLIASGGHRTAKIWDANTGRLVLTLDGLASVVISVVFSPDGTRILTAEGDAVRLWDSTTGYDVLRLRSASTVNDVAFSPDGRLIATGGEKLQFWDSRHPRR